MALPKHMVALEGHIRKIKDKKKPLPLAVQRMKAEHLVDVKEALDRMGIAHTYHPVGVSHVDVYMGEEKYVDAMQGLIKGRHVSSLTLSDQRRVNLIRDWLTGKEKPPKKKFVSEFDRMRLDYAI